LLSRLRAGLPGCSLASAGSPAGRTGTNRESGGDDPLGDRIGSKGMTTLDWFVVAAVVVLSIVAGIMVMRSASRNGALSYFTSDRNLPWWAIAISNTATYQSGNGGFVMLMVTYGLAANWLWWSSWIIWMPLVAVVWAPLWRRMQI